MKDHKLLEIRMERAAHVYPGIKFSRAGNILYYTSDPVPPHPYLRVLISSVQVDDLVGPTRSPIYFGLRSPIAEIGDDKPLPEFPGLYVRDGRIQGDPDGLVIALADQLIDPIMINYDMREIRTFLIDLNRSRLD